MKKRSYTYDNCTGWLANNPRIRGQNTFVDSLGMNIRAEAPNITPNGLSSVRRATITNEMYCNASKYLFWQNGEIRVINATIDVVCSTADGSDILWAHEYDWYLYFWHNQGYWIGRILVSEAEGSTDWTAEASYDETYYDWWPPNNFFERSDSVWVLTTIFNGILYFTTDTKVHSLDFNWQVELSGLNLPTTIVGLQKMWSRLKVYEKSGIVSFWDWLSTAATENIDLVNDIQYVHGRGWLDYLITGRASVENTPYVMWGYETQQIVDAKEIGYRMDFWGENVYYSMAIKDRFVYMTWGNAREGIYVYAPPVTGQVPAFSYDHHISWTGLPYSQIFMITYYNHRVFVCYEDTAWGKGIDELLDSGTQAGSYLVYAPFDAGVKDQRKTLQEIQIRGDAVVSIAYDRGLNYKRTDSLQNNIPREVVADLDSSATDTLHSNPFNRQYSIHRDFYTLIIKVEWVVEALTIKWTITNE